MPRSLIIKNCEYCNKETEFILLDSEDGKSFAFCSWYCFHKWKSPDNKRPVKKGRGNTEGTRFKKTLNKIPDVLAQNNKGKSIRDIMKATGLAKNTVRSIIKNPPRKLEDLEPGCTKDEFHDLLKKVCRVKE
jgi:hypothetical protein